MRPAFILLSDSANGSPPGYVPEGKPLHNFINFVVLKKET